MSFSRHQDGFSLIELVTAVAIITIVAAVGLPAYRSYVDIANMTQVNSAYQNAVQTVQGAYSKDTARITLGLTSDLPTSGAQWVTFLDDDSTLAPGQFISLWNQARKLKRAKRVKAHPNRIMVIQTIPERLKLSSTQKSKELRSRVQSI
ncbi:MAG: prepilin-type N-terminal cleavage/methylation domain-containing protein [Pseudomonadales bacterium]|nr:prepilin-type N-terminal cleavage/methylation domain-containing protein [Pseudomonadales bacterium]MDG1441658.1 prepilin-type N-terminal cleavage/methylation domain-containing protein [Pseudomonadales bacterium]